MFKDQAKRLMSRDKSLLTCVFEHRQHLNNTIDAAISGLSLASANQLKAQVLIISQWLWELSPSNSDLVSSLSLYHPDKYSDLSNRAFCSAILTSRLCHQLNWHGLSAKALISCALTMDIGLGFTVPALVNQPIKVNKLTKQQLQHYRNHPLTSASYLHKYNIISKAYLKYVIEHQELLNGRGFPKGLRHHQISTPSKMLSLVAKFSELINLGHHQSGSNLRQILNMLAQSDALYCPQLLRLLATIINQPKPAMIITYSGQQQGLVINQNLESDTLSVLELVNHEQQGLFFGQSINQVKLSAVSQLTTNNALYNETIFTQHWAQISDEQVADRSSCGSRLKPQSALAQLRNHLSSSPPDKQKIEDLINQQTEIGQQLINQLSQQHPNRQFNSSFHALKMAGFEQSNALIGQLGLVQQLNNYDFPVRTMLSAKVNCVMAICRLTTTFTSCVLPHQAAMFALINLAPLYFERRVIEMPARPAIKLDNLLLNQGYSLMALTATSQQTKISASLAQHWDNRALTHNSLALLANPEPNSNLYQQEIIKIFQLALCLTHHIFHGISVDAPKLNRHAKPLFKQLKLVNQDIKQLVDGALEQAPYCTL